MSQPIDPKVVELLRCPATGLPLRVEGDRLVSDRGTSYPIRDGIPVLLPDSAHPSEDGARSDRSSPDRR
jgi:uncharacterized protein YbaR (Trm112 family)